MTNLTMGNHICKIKVYDDGGFYSEKTIEGSTKMYKWGRYSNEAKTTYTLGWTNETEFSFPSNLKYVSGYSKSDITGDGKSFYAGGSETKFYRVSTDGSQFYDTWYTKSSSLSSSAGSSRMVQYHI